MIAVSLILKCLVGLLCGDTLSFWDGHPGAAYTADPVVVSTGHLPPRICIEGSRPDESQVSLKILVLVYWGSDSVFESMREPLDWYRHQYNGSANLSVTASDFIKSFLNTFILSLDYWEHLRIDLRMRLIWSCRDFHLPCSLSARALVHSTVD